MGRSLTETKRNHFVKGGKPASPISSEDTASSVSTISAPKFEAHRNYYSKEMDTPKLIEKAKELKVHDEMVLKPHPKKHPQPKSIHTVLQVPEEQRHAFRRTVKEEINKAGKKVIHGNITIPIPPKLGIHATVIKKEKPPIHY